MPVNCACDTALATMPNSSDAQPAEPSSAASPSSQPQAAAAKATSKETPKRESKVVAYDSYIDDHVRRTGRSVKTVELWRSVLKLATGWLLFLLVAALLEHWATSAGFSTGMRTLLFVLAAAATGYEIYRSVWPLIRQRINPIYAAQTIEQSDQRFKNRLVNLLLLRQNKQTMQPSVYQVLEQQAAQGLADSESTSVERSDLIRWGYVLVGLIGVMALYLVVSPKNPLTTAVRLLAPWADIPPASRVEIANIEPGATSVSQAETLTITADISGLREEELARILVSTVDGQTTDYPIEMLPTGRGRRYSTTIGNSLGSGSSGALPANLQSDFRYRLEAGDARSRSFLVEVLATPTIAIAKVDYDYPEYTGYRDRTVQGGGDLRAIEGTRITLHAQSNLTAESAQIDFDVDGRPNVRMQVAQSKAVASFPLSLKADGEPRFSSYALRYTTPDGRHNTDPAKYKIEVLADYPPEAQIVEPASPTIDVRQNETVTILVEARDVDFALSSVRLLGQVSGEAVFQPVLLKQRHEGRFTGKWQFTPSRQGLKPGDVVTYWAEAKDVKQPVALVALSTKKQIRVLGPAGQDAGDEQIARQDPNDKRQPNERGPNGQQPNEGQQNKGQQGEQNREQNQGDQNQQGGSEQQNEESSSQGQQTQGQQAQDQQSGDQENSDQQGEQSESGGAGLPSNDASSGSEGDEQQTGQGTSGNASEDPSQGESSSDASASGGDSANSAADNSTGNEQGESGSQGNPDREQQEGSSGSKGESGSEGGGDESPVASNGDDDGAAFDRIREHLNQQGSQQGKEQREGQSKEQKGQPPESGEGQQSSQGQETGADSAGDNRQPGDADTANKPSDNAGNQSQNEQAPSEQADENSSQNNAASPESSSGEPRGDAGNDGEQSSGDSNSAEQQGNRQENAGDEQGASSDGDPTTAPEDQPRQGAGSSGQNEAADQGQGEAADPGAGEDSTSGGQDQVADRQTGESGNQRGKGSQSRQSQSGDGNQGDSQSQADSQGQGQDADAGKSQAGQDSGNEESSDGDSSDGRSQQEKSQEGEAAGSQSQEGSQSSDSSEQSDQLSDQQSDSSEQGGSKDTDNSRSKELGEPGDKSEGSSQNSDRPKPQQGQPAKEQDQQPSDPSSNNESDPSQNPEGQSGERGAPAEGGDASGLGNSNSEARSGKGSDPGGDEANLEYARKQTDLILDELSEQLEKQEVDRKLLDKLGWTEQELKQFVQRWQQRRRLAERQTGGKQQLDEALRSLGLKSPNLQAKPSSTKDDLRDLNSGYRGQVPQRFQNRLRNYNRGVSKSAE